MCPEKISPCTQNASGSWSVPTGSSLKTAPDTQTEMQVEPGGMEGSGCSKEVTVRGGERLD